MYLLSYPWTYHMAPNRINTVAKDKQIENDGHLAILSSTQVQIAKLILHDFTIYI